MSLFNHAICHDCWVERNPGREAVVIDEAARGRDLVTCCYCGEDTTSGIWVREDPSDIPHHFDDVHEFER